MKEFILNIFRGMVIGLSNVIPGVSGGTMMVSMGIYDIDTFYKEVQGSCVIGGSFRNWNGTCDCIVLQALFRSFLSELSIADQSVFYWFDYWKPSCYV